MNNSDIINIDLLMEVKGLESVDLSRPDLGNPGVGGTQYCFLLLAFYLIKFYPSRFKVRIISPIPLKLPEGIDNIVFSNISELPSIVDNSILVAKDTSDLTFYDLLNKCNNLKVIIWAHNFLFGNVAKRIADSDVIKGVVYVSKQMYDFYLDDDIIKKSIPIFNIIPDVDMPERDIPSHPTLTFMGQIARHKGILTLLKIWKKVSQKYPDAHLNIIGKGTLYNRECKLGPLGLTEESLEREILPYITDSNGEVSNKVHLLGILGKEKYDVFSKSTVGLVNPSARTETFGMGIVEMGSSYLPVVTRNWNGHPDTGINGENALLGLSVAGMARKVCRLIEDPELNIKMGRKGKENVKRFSPDIIIPEWAELFERITAGKKPLDKRLPYSKPFWNNYKFIRAINAFLRFKAGLRFLPSTVSLETKAYRLLKG